MRKTIWLHHYEPMWEDGYRKFDTNFDDLTLKIIDFIVSEPPDKIIVTQFEDVKPDQRHIPLIEVCAQYGILLEFQTYGYGFYRDEGEDGDFSYPMSTFNENWIYGTRPHHGPEDVLEIDDWQKALKQNNEYVLLAGAFTDECLLDAQTVLQHLEVPYEDVEALQVGTFKEYEMKLDPDVSEQYEYRYQLDPY